MVSSLSEIRDIVRTLLVDAPEGRKLISDTVIDREINRVHRRLNSRHGLYRAQWYGTSVANKILYALPNKLSRLDRVYFGDDLLEIDNENSFVDTEDNEDIQSITWTEES